MISKIWSRGEESKRNCRRREGGEKEHGGSKGDPTLGQQPIGWLVAPKSEARVGRRLQGEGVRSCGPGTPTEKASDFVHG